MSLQITSTSFQTVFESLRNGNTLELFSIDQSTSVDLGTLELNVGAETVQHAIDQIVWTLTDFMLFGSYLIIVVI